MGMVVRTNTMAMNANRQLGVNNSQVAKSLEKLSSGFRINRAADDASGLAISEKMKAQIKGLEQASANSQDGISLIQTAEGATTEVHDMLNRMVELATKSANGTIQNQVDREAIQREVDDLNSEITRISKSTNFNGINLLDGSLGGGDDGVTSTFAAGSLNGLTLSGISSDVKSIEVVDSKTSTTNASGSSSVVFDKKTGKLTINVTAKDGTGTEVAKADIETALKNAGFADAKLSGTITAPTGAATTAGTVKAVEKTAATIAGNRGAGFSINFAPGKTGIKTVHIKGAANTGAIGTINTDGAFEMTLDNAKSYTAADINKMLSDAGAKGMTVDFSGSKSGADIVTGLGLGAGATAVTDGTGSMASGLRLQVGDTNDDFNHVSVAVDDLSAAGIGTAGLNVADPTSAGNAIQTIRDAINKVSTNRANLGSLQNRLEHTINNLDTTAENMTAANSRIRDTDMAKEMMNYTKQNILTQAAQAMLAQANQQPQAILQLLQ